SIANAALEIDAAGFGKVANRNGDVAKPETHPHRLNQKLRVKHEIVRILLKRDLLEHLAPVDTKTAVEVAQVLPQRQVLEGGQKPIGHVFIARHSRVQPFFARANAAAQNNVADPQFNERHGMRNNPAIVLVVGVNHYDDVRSGIQGVPIASLLIAAIASVG